MFNMYKETKSNFTIKIGGMNEIDVLEISNFLNSTYNTLIKITELQSKDAYFKLNFKATKAGSIVLELGALVPLIQTLFNDFTSQDIINIYLEILKIIKDLKGEPAKQINFKNNTIENYMGEVHSYTNNSINIYAGNNGIVSEVKRTLSHLRDRENVKYILDGLEKLTVEKSDIEKIEMEDTEEFQEQENFYKNEEVELIEIVLKGNKKWTLKFKNKNIKASIWDEEFLKIKENDKIILDKKILIDLREIIKIQKDKITKEYFVTRVYK